jgi:hypothetical protein
MNYEELNFLPILNGVTIIGNKRFEDYGIIPMSTKEIAQIQLEVFGYLL